MNKFCLFFLVLLSILTIPYEGAAAEKRLKTDLTVKVEGYYFNNADLRILDTSSRTMVEYTDDRSFLINSSLSGGIKSRVLPVVTLELRCDISGFWGNDSLSYQAPDQAIYFSSLNLAMDLAPLLSKIVLYDMRLIIGRRSYSSSEILEFPRYIWKDTVDAVQWYWKSKSGWGLDLILDFYSMNSPVYDYYSIQRDRHSDVVEYFDGAVNTIRAGFTPFYSKRFYQKGLKRVEFRPYLFYADIGASGSYDGSGGSEVSQEGMTSNVKDGDYLLIGGGSLYIKGDHLSTRLEGAYSRGRDYKLSGEVDASGLALHWAASLFSSTPNKTIFRLITQAVWFQGAETDTQGNIVNYGFTGFKGDTLGGFVYRQYYGIFPGTILNFDGFDFNTEQASRRAGTYSVMAGTRIKHKYKQKNYWTIDMSHWWYWDNNHSSLIEDKDTELSVLNQRRWSRFMGYELDLSFKQSVAWKWSWGIQGGLFLPGEYFSIDLPDSGIQGNSPALTLRLFTSISL